MSSPYTIRRAKIAPEDPILARVPRTKVLAAPTDLEDSPLGFSGLSTILKLNPKEKAVISAKVEIAGDLFCAVNTFKKSRRRTPEDRKFVLAVRDGKIRKYIELSTIEFTNQVLDIAEPHLTFFEEYEIVGGLHWNCFSRLQDFDARLLLSLAAGTVLFDPESLVPVAASDACSAIVDPSSTTKPSCVALRQYGNVINLYHLVRLDSDLRAIVQSEEELYIDIISNLNPQTAGFVNLALTSRGHIVMLEDNTCFNELLRVFDPDFREVYRESARYVELVAVAGRQESDGGCGETRLLLLTDVKCKKSSSPGWLLEIEPANGRYVSEE